MQSILWTLSLATSAALSLEQLAASAHVVTKKAGSCPPSYRLGAGVLRDAPTVRCSTLFSVGGLYGNPFALEAIQERVAREPRDATVAFNGDFNFFNAEPQWWVELNEGIRSGAHHVATAGNVETEMVGEGAYKGCGCGYPNYVSRSVVERSDRIVRALQDAARDANVRAAGLASWPGSDPDPDTVEDVPSDSRACADCQRPELIQWIRGLPRALVAEIAPEEAPPRDGEIATAARIAIVHGDLDSLAGWQLGVEAMEPPDEPLRRLLGCADPTHPHRYLRPTPRSKVRGW